MNYYPARLTELDRLCFCASFLLASENSDDLVTGIRLIQSEKFQDCFEQWAHATFADDIENNIVGAEAA